MEPSRLRAGEIAAGAAALALLALMFLVSWYGADGEARSVSAVPRSGGSVDAWDSLATIRWLMLVTILATLSLSILQGTRRAPALPVTLSVIVTVLGVLTCLALVYRVLIDVPGPGSLHAQAGAYLGLIDAGVLTAAAFRSLRVEDPTDAAGTTIRTVKWGPPV